MQTLLALDTSAWIEWLIASPLKPKLRQLIPDQEFCVVPTIVQMELGKWCGRELGQAATERVIAFTSLNQVVPLTTEIALLAAQLHRQHGLATADAIIYATARQSNAHLLTCDGHFEGLEAVIYLPKTFH